MLTQSTEDYLKAIYNLQKSHAVSTNDLAGSLNISASSVTKMLKRLSDMGFVNYESHRGVNLSGRGEKEALRVIRKNRLLELFLVQVLGYSWDEVHDEACMLEHVISDRFEDALYNLLEKPTHDPHGDPIPTPDGKLPETNAVPLMECEPGDKVKIYRILHDDAEILRYIEKLGLLPNTEIIIKDKVPFGGTMIFTINGEEKMIGEVAASDIFVVKPE
jgi:DtxR family Mn-dependent transcriptional regulator